MKQLTKKIIFYIVLSLITLMVTVLYHHLKDFPFKAMQYDESRGVTVTIYDLQDKERQPIRLTTGEFFRNLDPETEAADYLALPLKGKKVELKLSDFETQYRMVFHKKGLFIGYGYICRVDPEKVAEKDNKWGDGKFFYDCNGSYYAYRYDFRTYRMSQRQTESFAQVIKNWN